MIRLIKSALSDLWRQPVLGIVSVVGTALAIYLIMIVVILQDVKTAPIAPESNRDRFLHCTFGSFKSEGKRNFEMSTPYTYPFVREYFYPLSTPEAVTAYAVGNDVSSVSASGGRFASVESKYTDAGFWRVFDFTFISGAPYTSEDVDAGRKVAVISESVARQLFGSTDVVGREFNYNYRPMTVCGVVKDVTSLATKAYAKMWIPLTSYGRFSPDGPLIATGDLSVTMLALSASAEDMESIRAEYSRSMASVSDANEGVTVMLYSRPYTHWKETCEVMWANMEPDEEGVRRTRMLTFLVLLLVPAVNLLEMTRSRMRRRYAEIGVRRAFGCTRSGIMNSILAENLVVTVFAGAVGLLLAFATCMMFDVDLFTQSVSYTDAVSYSVVYATDLFHWSTFGWALLFCFVLNLLSTGISAWRASRMSIVNAINGEIKR